MQFILERETLLKPLQQVNNCVTNRSHMPILGNLLLSVETGLLTLTGTDIEIEMICKVPLVHPHESGEITVPAKKFLDICKGLPTGALINVNLDGDRLNITSGRSRFSLMTLPAQDFPSLEGFAVTASFNLPQFTLKRLIDATQFSMAQQDVRFYLNGMLLEIEEQNLRTVATDGHRLALCAQNFEANVPANSVIIPRKGINELVRLLESTEAEVLIQIGTGNLRANFGDSIFTTKLIDGKFPDYRRGLPKSPDKIMIAETEIFKQALMRASVLSNERFRGVRLVFAQNQLTIVANNPEHEEAEETLDIEYSGTEIEIALNVSYLLDVLNILKTGQTKLLFTDSMSSVQVEDSIDNSASYVIMPMRI